MALALRCGLHAGVGVDPAEPEWPVVFIDLPHGDERLQVSWHIPQAEMVALPRYAGAWDGHTSAEKMGRIGTFLVAPGGQP